ncbi:hypothetical protein M959_12201, partial [Chaetura pelagica]
LSFSCLVCFSSFLFFLKSSHFGFLGSDPENKNKDIFCTWSFLFFASFSDCCLFLNRSAPVFPSLNCPFTNLLEIDLGFPSSSPFL